MSKQPAAKTTLKPGTLDFDRAVRWTITEFINAQCLLHWSGFIEQRLSQVDLSHGNISSSRVIAGLKSAVGESSIMCLRKLHEFFRESRSYKTDLHWTSFEGLDFGLQRQPDILDRLNLSAVNKLLLHNSDWLLENKEPELPYKTPLKNAAAWLKAFCNYVLMHKATLAVDLRDRVVRFNESLSEF